MILEYRNIQLNPFFRTKINTLKTTEIYTEIHFKKNELIQKKRDLKFRVKMHNKQGKIEENLKF